MKYGIIIAVSAVLALAGCSGETSGNTGSGNGKNSKGEDVTGNITPRDNGSMVFAVSDNGVACTAVFASMADREQANLTCTDGSRGTAVLRTGADDEVRAVAYFRGSAGSGSLTF